MSSKVNSSFYNTLLIRQTQNFSINLTYSIFIKNSSRFVPKTFKHFLVLGTLALWQFRNCCPSFWPCGRSHPHPNRCPTSFSQSKTPDLWCRCQSRLPASSDPETQVGCRTMAQSTHLYNFQKGKKRCTHIHQ
jgi:hypothetical protein